MTWFQATTKAATPTHSDNAPWLRAGVYARTRSHGARVAKARAAAEKFVEHHGRTIVCWSGGKDSTALACLVGDIPGVHIAHFASGLAYPGVEEWMHVTAEAQGWDYGFYQTGLAIEALKGNGSWDFAADAVDDAPDWWETIMIGPRTQAIESWGAHAMMWGLRADESQGRRWLLSKGLEFKSDGIPTLAPLAWWSVDDVWAIQASFSIEPCPVYTRLAEIGCPLEAQRLDIMVGSNGNNMGRFAWLQMGWPDEFDRIANELPRIREWT